MTLVIHAKRSSFREDLQFAPEKSGNNTTPSNNSRLGLVINLLKILINVGKYLPLIFASLAGLSIALALNDFARANFTWAIINLAFAVCDFFFLTEWYQRRKIRLVGYQQSLVRKEPMTVKVPIRETKRIILKNEEEQLSPLVH